MAEDSFTGAVDASAEILVVGAGPAGMAAACEAAEAGRDVTLVDDNPTSGGQIWRGGPRQSGESAAVWFDRLTASAVRVVAATAVVDRLPDGTVVTRSPQGIQRWRADSVILATGARERFLPFPGWTLPGVVGAGGLQALVKQGFDVTGRRILIAGTGPLLLAVADLVVQHGGLLEVVAEQASLARLVGFGARLVGQPAKLAQAIGIRRRIGRVFRTGTFPERVQAAGDGLVVSLASGAAGRERHRQQRCDILACGFGLVPNLEVPRLFGCEVRSDRLMVDPFGRTSVPDVFAAGEATGVGGVDKALVEGRIAGLTAAGRVEVARRLLPDRRRAEAFAASLDRTFSLDPRLRLLADDTTVVCRCEDVAAGCLRAHESWREAKLMTRIGMGPCQGRVCGPATQMLFGWSPPDVRPPLSPVSVAELRDTSRSAAAECHQAHPVP